MTLMNRKIALILILIFLSPYTYPIKEKIEKLPRNIKNIAIVSVGFQERLTKWSGKVDDYKVSPRPEKNFLLTRRLTKRERSQLQVFGEAIVDSFSEDKQFNVLPIVVFSNSKEYRDLHDIYWTDKKDYYSVEPYIPIDVVNRQAIISFCEKYNLDAVITFEHEFIWRTRRGTHLDLRRYITMYSKFGKKILEDDRVLTFKGPDGKWTLNFPYKLHLDNVVIEKRFEEIKRYYLSNLSKVRRLKNI